MKRGTHHTLEVIAKLVGNKNAEGHVTSPETRAKLRAGKLGPNNPNFGKHPGMGNKNCVGRKYTPETLAKMSAARTGKHQSAETRAKISTATSGPNNPAWLGGISRDPYGWDFNDELKEEVRRRDGYKCQKCGAPQAECKRKLSVHHIDYNKKNNDPVNLLALCLPCHIKTNTNRKHWTAFFQEKAIRRAVAELAGAE